MPEGGLPWLKRDEILSYEEIAIVVRAAASIGVRAIRLTGGEPLLRRDLHVLVREIATIPGIEDVALSTNALLLEEQIDELAAAGLHRINVSLDTLRADRFEQIAKRRPGLENVLAGIDAAIARGLRARQDQRGRDARGSTTTNSRPSPNSRARVRSRSASSR